MKEQRKTTENPTDSNERRSDKAPYKKPGFRFERVFETMALACGKLSDTQGPCHNNKKLS